MTSAHYRLFSEMLQKYSARLCPLVVYNRLVCEAAAVVPLGKALYHYCLVPQKVLKVDGPLVACL